MRVIQNFLFLLYFFSINFEQWDIFNTGIDFLITKVTVLLYLFSTIASYKSLYSLKQIYKNVLPIIFLFSLMTVMNFINKDSESENIFNLAHLLPIVLIIPLYNQSVQNSNLILKGLFLFSISAFFISLFALLGIFSTVSTEGIEGNRLTVFGNNQNDLGLRLVLAIFILFYIVKDSPLKVGKYRYLWFLFIPHTIYFIVQTGSRVSFISLLLGILIIIFTVKVKNGIKLFVLLPISIILWFLIYGFFLIDSEVVSRLNSSINMMDLSQRDIIWAASFGLFYESPLFGVGQTGYNAFISDALYGVSISPHNVFIEVFCYTGFFGFIIFIIFITPIFKYPFYVNYKTNNYLPLLLLVPLIGVLLSGQLFGSKTFFLIILYIIISRFNSNSKNIVT